MKNPAQTLSSLLFALLLTVGGCGKKDTAADGHGHADGVAEHGEEAHAVGEAPEHEHEEASGAEFKEGAGIKLTKPAREAIGLETAEVAERQLSLEFPVTARVFHAAHQHGSQFPGHKDGHAYANAMISSATADLLKIGQPVELNGPGGGKLQGRLSSLNRETTRAIGQAEAVIEIPDPDEGLEFGSFLKARFGGAERTAMVIPRSAFVDAATGTFVYARNGERWLRTPVKAGGATESFVEILDGLFEGDVVVSKGATDLWLIELRFTKGGGHSH